MIIPLEYCFECDECHKSMYLDDWCMIRDHATKHMLQCRPAKIDIFQVTPEGEIVSAIIFKEATE